MPAVGGSLLATDRPAPVAATEEAAEPTPVAPPPHLLLWVSAAVVLAGTAMVVLGALRTGVSWDEPFHVMRLRNFLDHGWFALDWSVGQGGSSAGESNTLVYGPVTMLLLHGLSVLVGVEGWGSVSTTPEAYAVRHLGVAAIGLVGTAAAAATTRLLLGSWRWALVTGAVLLALPMWAGHLMFNIKDVPVATGYSLLTLALVAMVRPASGRAARVARVACLVSGVALMVGTRPGMASAVLCGAVVLVGGLRLAHPRPALRPVVVELAVGLGLSGVLLVAVYPGVYAHPLRLLRSADQSASFRGSGGDYLYVPFHLVAQFPLLLQGAFAVGLLYAVRFALRHWRTDTDQAVRLALVVAQVAALPLVGIAKNTDFYNGLRQLLFAAPAWAILATVGLAHAIAWARVRGRLRLVGGVAAVALVAPVVDQALLFPYQYTYWNVALDATGVPVQSDYWRTSSAELLPDIPTDGPVVCSPTRSTEQGAPDGNPLAEGVDDSNLIAGRFSIDSSVDCRTDELGPLASRWAADERPYDDTLPHDEFYVVIDRDHEVPANCTRIASVDRHRHWRTVSMSYVARCHVDPPLLDQPVAFFRFPRQNMTPPQWEYAPLGWVMRESLAAIDSAGDEASLTFAVPRGCADCALLLDADAPSDLAVTVNHVPVDVDVRPGEVLVPLDPAATDHWVTFTRSSGEPLGLRVRTIRVVPSGAG